MENDFQGFITGMQHIGIPTEKLEETIAFYEMLGFQKEFQTLNEKSGGRVVFLKMKNVIMEIYEGEKTAQKSGAWDHIAWDVTDIDRVFLMVQEKQWHILESEIQFLPFWNNGVRFFTVIGPNQEKIEFNQYIQADNK